MNRGPRRRYWLEAGLAALCAALAVLTLITAEWIELIFRVDPDGGSGALEWAIAVGLGLAAAVLAAVARVERRRAEAVTA
jgi:hypothetical protein